MRTRESRHLLAVALPLGVVLVAGCTGSSGRPAAATANGAATPSLSAVSDCLLPPAACYTPYQLRAAYGIQPLLDRGIDGQGETVTDLVPAAPTNASGTTIIQSGSTTVRVVQPPGQPPAVTDIRQDLARFDNLFRRPAARIQVVTSLAGPASPWKASDGAVGDLEELHMVAPAATLRVVLIPPSVQNSAKNAAAGLIAGLRLAVSGTDVVSIGWDVGEHFFTKTQAAEMQSVLLGAAAHHVTVIASSGDTGGFSDQQPFGSTPIKEVSLPARPARAGRGRHHAHRESIVRRLHRRDRLEHLEQLYSAQLGIGGRLQPPVRPSRLSRWRPRDRGDEGRARRSR